MATIAALQRCEAINQPIGRVVRESRLITTAIVTTL
jgi:hypothetical protein